MTKVLQLAKPYTPEKLDDDVLCSIKHDGVPIRVTVDVHHSGVSMVSAKTRQDEDAVSCKFVVNDLLRRFDNGRVKHGRYDIVGEVLHEHHVDFKDISGVVRRQTPQTGLIFHAFDFVSSIAPEHNFGQRAFALQYLIRTNTEYVRCVAQRACKKDQIDDVFATMLRPSDEGGIVRSASDLWKPGKRTWGYQKYVFDPTIDLRIVGFEEATSEAGVPLGMVGRVLASYKGKTIGIGPGKLTHDERKELWSDRHMAMPHCIATIKYKRDPSYTALRQPTFQHFRPDKNTPDA